MTGCVLITRPAEDYADTAAMVAALGYEPVPCPMLVIEVVPACLDDLEQFQGLIFTSARALAPFCAGSTVRDLPVYTVGDATAVRARQAGFGTIISAGDDLAALEVLLASETIAEKPLLHLSGADIVRAITVPGVTVERRVVYRAMMAAALTPEALGVLRRGAVKRVLFYSNRTAQAFAEVITAERLSHQLMSVKALCLADSMVESLRALPWRGIRVAQRPDRSGMQALLADEKEMDTPMTSVSETPVAADDQNAIDPAEQVIERFGGIRPMAHKMSVPVTTVQGWKKRNVIPGNRREDVIRAARQNNIDISDILSKAVANDTSFQDVMQAAKAADKAVDTHYTPRHTVQADKSGMDQEALLGKIKQAETSAVKKSALITVVAISAVAIAAAVLLGPGQRGTFDANDVASATEVQALREDVERIDADVNSVKEDQFSLKNLIPADLGQTMADMKQQAIELKDSVTQLGTQVGSMSDAAKVIAEDVMGPQAGDLSQRITALQTQVQAVTGSTDLGGMFSRLAALKQSLQGQELLDKSTGQLSELLKGMNGDMSQLEPQLQAAQTQDTELGQALEGVSPTDLKAASMLLGLTQFRTSLHRSAPFEDDLALMQSMVGKDDPELQAAIERLAPQASKGVLTSKGLSSQLKGLTGDIVVSSIKGEDVSIREKAAARMNEVFQVQKNGELVTGTDTQAKIARAQKMLDDGKVDEAVSELQSLQGPALQTAQPLIDQALMTSLASQVSTMLTGKVAAQIPEGGIPTSGVQDAMGGLMGGLNALSPEQIGSNIGNAVKGAGSRAPYTAGGMGLEGVMKSMESMGVPSAGNEGAPIFMPQP